jgi:signal transduction histidine kinase/DNA-binding NarL/FixJ family response regulator
LNRSISSSVRRRWCAFGLCLLAAALVRGQTRASDYGFPIIETHLNADLGLNVATSTIVQAADGTIWSGGQTLHRFDGEHWTSLPLENVDGIFGLDVDPDGRLWIAAENNVGWLDKNRDGQWEFHSLWAKLPNRSSGWRSFIRVFAEKDFVAFVTENTIYRWNGREFQSWSMPGTRRLFSMRVDHTVYADYLLEGLYALRKNGPELFIPAQILGANAVLWMERRESDWLLAKPDGLFLYRDGRVEPFAPEVSNAIRNGRLTSGAHLPDGRYAFSLFGGIVLMQPDGALDRVLVEDDGLPTNMVANLMVDQEGNLWATSVAGVWRIDLGPEAIFDRRAGVPQRTYRYLADSREGFAVASGDAVLLLDSDRRHFRQVEGISSGIQGVAYSPHGLLIPGPHGVHLFEHGKLRQIFTSAYDAWDAFASRVDAEKVFVLDNRTIAKADYAGNARMLVRDLPSNPCTIAEDDVGNLWIGTVLHGAFVAQPDLVNAVQAIPVATSVGLPTLTGWTYCRATADGSIVLFANNGAWLKPRGANRFIRIENSPARSVLGVSFVAPDNTVWVAYDADGAARPFLARVQIERDHAIWQPHSVPGLNAIGQIAGIHAETAGDGSTILWIGGTKSVLRHVVTHGPSAPIPRTPLLSAFAQSGKDVALHAITAPLPYSTRAIRFEFAEPEFSRRALLRLETRIDGIDPDWLPVTADARRDLSAVRDGSYTFRVRAVAETGVASEPATFHFEVLPPWWRTAPAMLAGLFALVPLGYSGYRVRVRTLRRRNVELETKVRERTEELEQANAAKTEFVANMSHDIRNPLNGIVGLALALEDTRLDPKQREIVATLRECTTYLSSLVDDVLDFASIEAGRVEIRPGPFVPEELLHSIVTTLKADTASSGAALHVDIDPQLPTRLLGDAGRIQQILVNYVSNALKYAGGDIRLSAALAPGTLDEVEFCVIDQGPGVSAEDQATLFTKFTRLASARQHDIPGSGLGLAACRLLADIMGGSVGVDSAPGRGARFYLRLPLAATTAEIETATGDLPNTSVLLVEDTDYNALAATAVLRRLGLTCERARTGAEAIELFATKRFNLVLLDRNLPDMDGTEVARRMRELETDGPSAVLLAVTAYCTAADRQRCLDAGMDAFVGKPLTPEKLRRVLLAAGRRLLAAAAFEVVADPPMPTPAPAAGPAVDTSILDYLSDGTESGLNVQIERFLAGLAEAETRLQRFLSAPDYPSLARGAHELLASARMVGAARLIDIATQLERAAGESASARCTELLGEISAEIAAVKAALRHRHSAGLTA